MRLFLFGFLLLFSVYGFAQDSTSTVRTVLLGADNDATILYRHEASGGLVLHSNGWGITFKFGKHITGFRKRIIDFDFVSMKHPKEYRITNPYEGAKSFIFGKLNNVFLLRAGWGYQNVLFGKAEQSGVEVRLSYYGGLDLGLTKPIYLDILENDQFNDSLKVVVTKQYNPEDPDQTVDNIYGSASFFTGVNKMKAYPGVYGKFAISFEYAGWQQKIAALEAGVVVDYFPNAIPIIAFNPNPNLFFNFYISILWGGKW